jgi:hypothetical protein
MFEDDKVTKTWMGDDICDNSLWEEYSDSFHRICHSQAAEKLQGQNRTPRLVNRYLQIPSGNGIWQSRPFLKDMTTWCRCEWQTGWEHGRSQFGTKGNWLIQIARLHLWPRMHFSLHQNTIGKKHILVLHTCLFLSPQEVCSPHHCRYLEPLQWRPQPEVEELPDRRCPQTHRYFQHLNISK